MVSYFDGQLTDILPGNISKDPEIQALSYALQQGCRLLYKYSQKLYIYSDLDNQPEEIIDLMAAELRTQYYGNELDIEKKRQLVRNTLTWYMTAGTPAAIEGLVSTVFGEGKVTEWFEYGDKPYYFKVETNALITPETSSFFFDIIQKVKNTRSHLREVGIHRETVLDIKAGTGICLHYKPSAVTDGYAVYRKSEQDLSTGTTQFQSYRPAAIKDGFRHKGTDTRHVTMSGIIERTTYRFAAVIDGYSTGRISDGTLQAGAAVPCGQCKNFVKERNDK